MMRWGVGLVLLVGAMFAGCTPKSVPVFPKPTIAKNYELGEVLHAAVGEPIFDVETAREVPMFIALREHRGARYGLGRFPDIHGGQRFRAVRRVPADGSFIIQPADGDSRAPSLRITSGGVVLGWVTRDKPGGVVGRGWPEEPLFRRSDEITGQDGAFRAQIVYSGLSGNTIRALYREYVDDMARPAFSQELQYDLAESRRISFRSVEIEVLDATNSSLEYQVVEDGGLPWLPAR